MTSPVAPRTSPPTASAEPRHVRYECSDHVVTLTFDRPDRLNALTARTLAELGETLRSIADDPQVRVVVLTGAGRAFSAGGDYEALAAGPVTAEFVRASADVVRLLHSLRPVTIAAVNGACAGGGMALACATDLRIAAESAFFTSAFIRIGATGDLGLPWFLTRLVGSGRARMLSLLSERVPAAEAERIGLVEKVVPDAELAATVAAIAADLAGFAPLALAGLKCNLADADVLDLPEFLDVESARYGENSNSADACEGFRSFVERRPPAFRGV